MQRSRVDHVAISRVIQGLAIAGALASMAGCVQAQASNGARPLERSEPHEALGFFEGTWTVPGRQDWRESCTWLPEGRRHIVCRPRWDRPDGAVENLSVYSYDDVNGTYVVHGFKSNGRFESDRGQRLSNGFRFMSDSGTGADRVRERFTLEEGVAGRVTAVSEKALADGPWVVNHRTDYLRTRP